MIKCFINVLLIGTPSTPSLLQALNGKRFVMTTRWLGWCRGRRTFKAQSSTSCWTPAQGSRWADRPSSALWRCFEQVQNGWLAQQLHIIATPSMSGIIHTHCIRFHWNVKIETQQCRIVSFPKAPIRNLLHTVDFCAGNMLYCAADLSACLTHKHGLI